MGVCTKADMQAERNIMNATRKLIENVCSTRMITEFVSERRIGGYCGWRGETKGKEEVQQGKSGDRTRTAVREERNGYSFFATRLLGTLVDVAVRASSQAKLLFFNSCEGEKANALTVSGRPLDAAAGRGELPNWQTLVVTLESSRVQHGYGRKYKTKTPQIRSSFKMFTSSVLTPKKENPSPLQGSINAVSGNNRCSLKSMRRNP